MKVFCDFCSFSSSHWGAVLRHTLNVHSADVCMRISCPVSECKYVGQKTWHAVRLHLQRKHGVKDVKSYFDNLPGNCMIEEESHAEDGAGSLNAAPVLQAPDNCACIFPGKQDGYGESTVEKVYAKHLLSLETVHRVSKAAVNRIACATSTMANHLLDLAKEKVVSALGCEGEDAQTVDECFEQVSPRNWPNLETTQRRKTFYCDQFTFVSQEEVLMGCSPRREENGKMGLKKHRGAFVPLSKFLETLLSLPEIWHFYVTDHTSNDAYTRDLCDGSYIKNHKLTKAGHRWLQFILYYDDLEMQNPLKSNQVHKLSMFYFTLANIPPQHRSGLQNIFVAAVARSKDVKKFGLTALLGDFIKTLNKLQAGMVLNINGRDEVIRGDLVAVLADTPAAALLSGMKESSGWAYSFCRMCRTTNDQAKTLHLSSQLVRRELSAHMSQCQIVCDGSLTQVQRAFWSKMYGINCAGILSRVTDFPLTSNVLQDPMHCILEGCFMHVLALFLKQMVDTGIFSRNDLDGKLRNFQYSYIDKERKPMPIDWKHVTENDTVKQKASAMLTLAYILPFILGEMVDLGNKHYRHLLSLINITISCFSPLVDVGTESELRHLVESYYRDFLFLYPHIPPRPKMHFLLHLPDQMREFGPLRMHNVLRFEAKHGSFKEYRWRNFINLPLSMLEKHQLKLCNDMCRSDGKFSTNFVYKGDNLSVDKTIDSHTITNIGLVCPPCDKIVKLKMASVNGLTYREGVALVLKHDKFGLPSFGFVRHVLSLDGDVHFVARKLRTKYFSHKFNAFAVEARDTMCMVKLSEIVHKWPIPAYERQGELLITLRHPTTLAAY